MNKCYFLVLIGFVCSASTWAASSNLVTELQEDLPAWASQTQFEEHGGKRTVFVGIGHAGSVNDAKELAIADAQAQFLLAVGGVVITSQKVVESSNSGKDGLFDYSRSVERYTGSASQAFFYDAESEFVAQRSGKSVTGYFRLSLPTESIEVSRDEAAREQRIAILGRVEARRLAIKSRTKNVEGYRYAVAHEQASVNREASEMRIAVEYEARRKARHQARVAAANQLYGASVRVLTVDAGNQMNASYSDVSGLVRSEIVAERVWWEGSTAVAESFVLGWMKEPKL